jgi:hypothetical protein
LIRFIWLLPENKEKKLIRKSYVDYVIYATGGFDAENGHGVYSRLKKVEIRAINSFLIERLARARLPVKLNEKEMSEL